jgi:hypothetical protein
MVISLSRLLPKRDLVLEMEETTAIKEPFKIFQAARMARQF